MSAASTIDDRTAAVIRQAIAEAGAGRLNKACAIAEQALSGAGDPVALHTLLGMLHCQTANFEIALGHLRIARAARSNDLSIARNLTVALVETGRLKEAYSLTTRDLAKADESLTIFRYRGYIAQLLGRTQDAVEAYEAIVRADPVDWQSWNNLANARLLLADYDGAVPAFEESLRLNAEPKLTWLNSARALVKAGKLAAAEDRFRIAARRFPEDTQALSELHDLLKRMGREVGDVLQVLEELHRRDPENRETLLALAARRMAIGDSSGSETAIRRVLRRNSADGEAFLELARLYEHASPEKLPQLVQEADRESVSPPSLNVLRAFVHRRTGNFTAGVAELRDVPADFDPQIVQDLRGQLLDKLGDHDAAFAAFTLMNEAHAADSSAPLKRSARQRARLRNQLSQLTPDWIDSWQAVNSRNDERDPVFLVGFPRSGTTLLDTMLMGHSGVTVMEEEPVLQEVGREFGGFEALPSMDEGRVLAARALYFDVAGRYGYVPGCEILIDKSPLQLTQVPLIHRLFPNARFILALRHPVDAVLSCYFSNFHLNAAMSNFLLLDTAAEFYDLVFSMWTRSTDLLPINVHSLRYEDLVEDPETQLRATAAAMGLEWHMNGVDHTETALARGLVKTASYAQVTKPIYRSSVGRWRHYRKQLEPILPTLRPWADKFGYAL